MWFALYTAIAIMVLILHYTGWLVEHNMEWLIYLLAATVFPAAIYL